MIAMRFRHGVAMIFCLLALSQGCAKDPRPGLSGVYQTWDDVISRWIGARKEDLFYELGPPTFHSEALKDGYEEMMWDMTLQSLPGMAREYGTLPLTESQVCKLVFLADKDGVIASGRRIGCK
jgi:hypothetical protein